MTVDDAYLYYSPEKFGLRVVGELEDPLSCYDFDTLVVWQHEDGRILWGVDSGCSCPSPFEDYDVSDLYELTTANWPTFARTVDMHCVDNHRGELPSSFSADKTDLLRKVSELQAEARKARLG